jgi:NADH-quinone oxidoreductase subunit J
MSIALLAFYLFAAVTVLSGLMVISARNPVHAVLFLILAFFNAAALFLLAGAEFIAMILVIVYVGAVAVLFLFVVMMLDINFAELRQGFLKYLPIGTLVALVLLAELVIAGQVSKVSPVASKVLRNPIPAGEVSNTTALGQIMYTDYFIVFQLAGMILLVAMIGAIVLTHRTRIGVLRQKISSQVSRKRSDAVKIVHINSGEGLLRGKGE